MDRGERRHRTENVVNRRKEYLERIYKGSKLPIPERKYGRLRDRHPYDCGKPGCMCCNAEKVLGIKSPKIKKADLDFGDQLRGDNSAVE